MSDNAASYQQQSRCLLYSVYDQTTNLLSEHCEILVIAYTVDSPSAPTMFTHISGEGVLTSVEKTPW